MKTKQEIGIGDPVEVRFAVRPPMMLFEEARELLDTRPSEVWRPGTVCSIDRDKIGVAFASGVRMAMIRRSNTRRPA